MSVNSYAQDGDYRAELDMACECIGDKMDAFLPLLEGWLATIEAHPEMQPNQALQYYIVNLNESERQSIFKQSQLMSDFFEGLENDPSSCLNDVGNSTALDELSETEEGREKILNYVKTTDCRSLEVMLKLAVFDTSY